jgi:ABC-type amino acid transport substrate-binding protein
MRIKTRAILAFLAAATLAPASLRAAPPESKLRAHVPGQSSLALADLSLDADALSWIEARRSGDGRLRIAMRERADSYVTQADGSVRGFDYDLVIELARILGLEPDIAVQKTIDAFFTREGVMPADLGTGGDYSYTPDLLKTVDFYAAPFGITAWREKLATWIPLWPTRSLLAGRKGEEILGVRQLADKRIAVIKDSIPEKTLRNLAAREGIRLYFSYAASEEECFSLVESGGADYVLDASVVMAKSQNRHRDLSLSPFPEPVITIGWAVKPGDKALAAILTAYAKAAQARGLFAELWTKTFLMDFGDYLDAVLASSEGGG